jgi:hypothetical protein
MNAKTKILLGAGGALTCTCAVLIYLLFHGYFDRGFFEVKQAVWFSPNLVAMDALRWDRHSVAINALCSLETTSTLPRSLDTLSTATLQYLMLRPTA